MTEREIIQQPSIKKYILTSYKELLKERSPEKISVKQIAEHAGINRSTFYLHFQHKDEVLHAITEEKLSELISHYYGHNTQIANPQNTTMQICKHIYLNRGFYKELIVSKSFQQRLYHYLFDALFMHLKNEALASFTTYGTMGFLFDWISNDCQKPIQEIATALSSIADFRSTHFLTKTQG